MFTHSTSSVTILGWRDSFVTSGSTSRITFVSGWRCVQPISFYNICETVCVSVRMYVDCTYDVFIILQQVYTYILQSRIWKARERNKSRISLSHPSAGPSVRAFRVIHANHQPAWASVHAVSYWHALYSTSSPISLFIGRSDPHSKTRFISTSRKQKTVHRHFSCFLQALLILFPGDVSVSFYSEVQLYIVSHAILNDIETCRF